ncbi:uncharacterized protein TRIADDRAFT_61521 [Trichoplax adhaerens]|uniref:pantothenate kinase n=1 Tax=Trichoplax adhaerens TaxID=10228 RepID=B3SB80_TRIAD|nr:hypothetical protein TRIADDRAFT_61521 [Trichoplax adhaerens]EDV20060.1 hypothetical protein TRIADDRAFT_61521 [Trichoplax adhaerens]|eukprot:XP_002117444.1 hypothetical protein TRIADDRAFT_61521 [Trichoplax adhaerens]
MDIGGSLAKVVFFEPNSKADGAEKKKRIVTKHDLTRNLSSDSDNSDADDNFEMLANYVLSNHYLGDNGIRDQRLEMHDQQFHGQSGTLHFIHFLTSRMDECFEFAKTFRLPDLSDVVCATGGGAYKYEGNCKEILGMKLRKYDELECLIKGIHYIYAHNPLSECYFWEGVTSDGSSPNARKVPYDFGDPYPYIVVNFGSGVSILAVQSPDEYYRVTGSSIGGGTFLGLCCLLTGCETFEEALRMAENGDSTKVDKLVRDIYGGSYDKFNLPGSTVAASFGHMMHENKRKQMSKSDLARAALVTITNNIGSIAMMTAHAQKIQRIVFVGNFLRTNDIAMKMLAHALNYWSQGTMKALFLEHEGYFGAVGALLKLSDQVNTEKNNNKQ